MKISINLIALFASAALAGAPALAAAPSPDVALMMALKINKSGKDRLLGSGDAIASFVKAGMTSNKPARRIDYVDYRVITGGSVNILGGSIVGIEEEYIVRSIGCCANPGIAAIITKPNDMTKVEEFAVNNKCTVSDANGFISSLKGIPASARLDPNQLIRISCREADLL